MDHDAILSLYAQGLFPMDDPGAGPAAVSRELPWWVADPRTVFELDEASRAALRRRVRRSLRARDDWQLGSPTPSTRSSSAAPGRAAPATACG